MQNTPPTHDAEEFKRMSFAIVLFNLLPLCMVAAGEWRAFDVIAFYWVEVVAAGVLAILRLVLSLLRELHAREYKPALGSIVALIGFPLHFGFFIVLTCFLVGSFLPEGTATRKLSSPFVPMELVLENIDFWKWFLIVLAWEAALFAYRNLQGAERGFIAASAVMDAYARLFILFGSGFFGLLLAMAADERLLGAVVLVAVKTLVTLAIVYAKEKPPQDSSGGGPPK